MLPVTQLPLNLGTLYNLPHLLQKAGLHLLGGARHGLSTSIQRECTSSKPGLHVHRITYVYGGSKQYTSILYPSSLSS